MSAVLLALFLSTCPQPSHCTIIGRSCIPGSPFGTCCDGGFCTRHLPPPHTDFQCALTTTTTTTTSIPASTTTSTAGTTSSTTTTVSTTSTTTVSTSTTTTTTSGGTTTTGAFVTDDFERASLGGNWTQETLFGTSCIIVGSSDLSVSAADASANCYWTANTPAVSNQYACAQLSGQGHGESGVCLGFDALGNGTCCDAWNDGTAAAYWIMNQYTNGPETFPDTANSPVFSAGDYIGIQRTSATSYRCYRSTNGTTWTALGSGAQTITTNPNPGAWGAQTGNDGDGFTPFMLEVWEGGNGGLPTARACGTP